MSDEKPITIAINVSRDYALIMAACTSCRLAVACSSPEDAVEEAITHAETMQCNTVRIVEVMADGETEGKKIVQDAIDDARRAAPQN